MPPPSPRRPADGRRDPDVLRRRHPRAPAPRRADRSGGRRAGLGARGEAGAARAGRPGRAAGEGAYLGPRDQPAGAAGGRRPPATARCPSRCTISPHPSGPSGWPRNCANGCPPLARAARQRARRGDRCARRPGGRRRRRGAVLGGAGRGRRAQTPAGATSRERGGHGRQPAASGDGAPRRPQARRSVHRSSGAPAAARRGCLASAAVRLTSRRADDADVIRARLRALLAEGRRGGWVPGATTTRRAPRTTPPDDRTRAPTTRPTARGPELPRGHRAAPGARSGGAMGSRAGGGPVALDRRAARRAPAGRVDVAGPAAGRARRRRRRPAPRRRRADVLARSGRWPGRPPPSWSSVVGPGRAPGAGHAPDGFPGGRRRRRGRGTAPGRRPGLGEPGRRRHRRPADRRRACPRRRGPAPRRTAAARPAAAGRSTSTPPTPRSSTPCRGSDRCWPSGSSPTAPAGAVPQRRPARRRPGHRPDHLRGARRAGDRVRPDGRAGRRGGTERWCGSTCGCAPAAAVWAVSLALRSPPAPWRWSPSRARRAGASLGRPADRCGRRDVALLAGLVVATAAAAVRGAAREASPLRAVGRGGAGRRRWSSAGRRPHLSPAAARPRVVADAP